VVASHPYFTGFNPSFVSCAKVASPETKVASNGINTNELNTPPATNTPEILGPIIYPTPRYSGVISPFYLAEGRYLFLRLVT